MLEKKFREIAADEGISSSCAITSVTSTTATTGHKFFVACTEAERLAGVAIVGQPGSALGLLSANVGQGAATQRRTCTRCK